MANTILTLLMYLVIPLWIGAGIADWIAHKKTNIEQTSGTYESVLHVVLILEIGLPFLMALFAEVNAAFFLISGLALLMHQITIYVDLKYAYSLREISPFEQMVHGVQEILPLTAVLMLAGLSWEQFSALFGGGAEHADLTIRFKSTPLPLWYTSTVSVLGIGIMLLFIEELARCIRCTNIRREGSARSIPMERAGSVQFGGQGK